MAIKANNPDNQREVDILEQKVLYWIEFLNRKSGKTFALKEVPAVKSKPVKADKE